MLEKEERGRGVLSLLYLDPALAPTNRRGRSYIYTLPPAHPPTRVSTTSVTRACALVGFEGVMDIDMASTASLSLRRLGSGSTLRVEGRRDRVQSQDRGQSRRPGMNRKRRRRKDHRRVGVVRGRVPVRGLTRGWVRRRIRVKYVHFSLP